MVWQHGSLSWLLSQRRCRIVYGFLVQGHLHCMVLSCCGGAMTHVLDEGQELATWVKEFETCCSTRLGIATVGVGAHRVWFGQVAHTVPVRNCSSGRRRQQ